MMVGSGSPEKQKQIDLDRINNSPDFIAEWERMLLEEEPAENDGINQPNDMVESRATVFIDNVDKRKPVTEETLTEDEKQKYDAILLGSKKNNLYFTNRNIKFEITGKLSGLVTCGKTPITIVTKE